MGYQTEEALASLSGGSEKKIGRFVVRRDTDFIFFTPTINYKGENHNRLKIRPSTFKHFGPQTLHILFEKLIPGLDGRNYEETLHTEYNEKLPSSVILSTDLGDLFPNVDPKTGKKYTTETQSRSHNVRVSHDSNGPYLDWPHLSPIRADQYNIRKSRQSKETPT